ncbi:MAG: prepilin-type N-terminal cleavage/methylation domain-containing protein [Myxococcota bacterium]|nr:prepilin-type N-terminal cleavage/methylation domain-containing protein [Myxococcota bacterium]
MTPRASSCRLLAGAAVERRGASTRGYTVIEVLMAMCVMSIGVAAVISMLKTSVGGNVDARRMDVANSIARTWVERLQRDAMQWTMPGPSFPAGNNLATALVLAYGTTNAGTWFAPVQYAAAAKGSLSPGFDILGRDRDLADAVSPPYFCVNVRMTWLPQAGQPQDLVRADVRVLWPRSIVDGPPAAGICDDSVAKANQPSPLTYHSIYVTTALKGNPL